MSQRACLDGDGSAARPHRTIASAAAAAPAGSVLSIDPGPHPENGRLPLLLDKPLTLVAASTEVEIGRVYTERLAQLSGDYDPEYKPHLNFTKSWGVTGVDLGANVWHCDKNGRNCRLYFFFGDNLQQDPSPFGDLVAHAALADPERTGIRLVPVRPDSKSFFAPFSYRARNGSIVIPGRDETPTGAFSYGGSAYVFVVTGGSQPVSHLTQSTSPGAPTPFRELFELSPANGKRFFQVAPVVVKNAEIPGLPALANLYSDGVILLGYGEGDFRGDGQVSAAWLPLRRDANSEHAPPSGAEIWYYQGPGSWTLAQTLAKRLFPTTTPVSQLSLAKVKRPPPDGDLWVVLYQRTSSPGEPGAILARTGRTPWEWSREIELFEPYRDGAYGRFMHREGCDSNPRLTREFRQNAYPYGAYIISPYSRWNGAQRSVTIYYLMSTWAPYQVQLMRSTIRVD